MVFPPEWHQLVHSITPFFTSTRLPSDLFNDLNGRFHAGHPRRDLDDVADAS